METRKCSIIISRQKAFTFSSIGLQRNGTRTKVDCFHSLGNDCAQIFMRLWALNNTNLETLQQIKGKGVHFRLMCVSEKRLKTSHQPRSQIRLLLAPGEKEEPGNEIIQARYHYRPFSHDVTAAIFVYKTMNRRPCLCTKKILWELNSFHMLKLSFIPSNLQSC